MTGDLFNPRQRFVHRSWRHATSPVTGACFAAGPASGRCREGSSGSTVTRARTPITWKDLPRPPGGVIMGVSCRTQQTVVRLKLWSAEGKTSSHTLYLVAKIPHRESSHCATAHHRVFSPGDSFFLSTHRRPAGVPLCHTAPPSGGGLLPTAAISPAMTAV
jgi:hypothetical protein